MVALSGICRRIASANEFVNSDTPYSLALSAIEAIPVLAGTVDTGFDFTVYTGDLVSHDPDNQLSRAYVEYAEVEYPSQDYSLKLIFLNEYRLFCTISSAKRLDPVLFTRHLEIMTAITSMSLLI